MTFTFADLKGLLVERIGMSEEEVGEDPALAFDEMDLDFPPAMKRESRYGMLVASARPDRSVPGVVGQ